MKTTNKSKCWWVLLQLLFIGSLVGQDATLRVFIEGDEGGWSPHWDRNEVYLSGQVLSGLTAGDRIGIDLVPLADKWRQERVILDLAEGENIVNMAYMDGPELDLAIGQGLIFFKANHLRHEIRGGNATGSHMVGNYFADGIWRPALWLENGERVELGRLDGVPENMMTEAFQTVQGVSADGRLLVGRSVDNSLNTKPTVWQVSPDGAYVATQLPVRDGWAWGRAIAVNEAGNVIVGTHIRQGGVWMRLGATNEWYLHAETGLGVWQDDPSSEIYEVWLYDVSADGAVAVGWIELWEYSGNMDSYAVVFEDGVLSALPGASDMAFANAYSITADGNRVVGVIGFDEKDHLAIWRRQDRNGPWTLETAEIPEPFQEINIPQFANRYDELVFAPLVGSDGSLYEAHVWQGGAGFASANNWFEEHLGVSVSSGYRLLPRFYDSQLGLAYGGILGGGARVGFRLEIPRNLQLAELRVEADGPIPEGHPAEWRVSGGKWYPIGSTGKVAAGDQILEVRAAPGFREVPAKPLFLEAGASHVHTVRLAEHPVRLGDRLASMEASFPNHEGRFFRAIPDGHGGIWASDGIGGMSSGLGNDVSGALYRLDANTGQPVNGFSLKLTDPSVWVMDVFPDGSALVISRNGDDEFLRKVRLDGSEDPDFHPFRVNRTRMAKVLQNGDIVVAVAETVIGGPIRDALVYRLRPNGRVDPRWQVARLGTSDEGPWETNVWARFVEDANGRILIAGAFASVNGEPSNFLARLQPDGRLDSSFQSEIIPRQGRAFRGLGLQADGKIILGGVFATLEDPFAIGPVLVRLNQDGSMDHSFQAPAFRDILGDFLIYDLVVLPDNRIVLAGSMGVVRLLPDGSLDTSFNQVVSSPQPGDAYPEDFLDYHFWVEPLDDTYLLAGSLEYGAITQGVRHFGLYRVNSQGTIIPEFAPPQPFSLTFPNRALVMNSGEVLSWGVSARSFAQAHTPRLGSQETHNFLRLEVANGTISGAPFLADHLSGMQATVRDLVALPSGRVFALIYRTNLAHTELVEITGNGLTVLTEISLEPGEDYRAMKALGDEAVALFFAGHQLGIDADNRQMPVFRMLTYNVDGQLIGNVTHWQDLQITPHPDFFYEEYAFASTDGVNLWHVDNDMRMLITTPDDFGNPVLHRHFSGGAIDPSFPSITFTSYDTLEPRSAWISSLQTMAQRFESAAKVHAVEVLADGSVLVAGEFDEAFLHDGQHVAGSPFVKITPTGHGQGVLSQPLRFSGDSSVEIHDMLQAGNFIYVVGTFRECNDAAYHGLVRLFSGDLSIDHRFQPGVVFTRYDYVNSSPSGLAKLPDGHLLVMGQFRKPTDRFPKPFHVLDTRTLGPWHVEAAVSDSSTGTVLGAGQHADGSVFTLTAVPEPGYQFVGWQGAWIGHDNPLRGITDENLSFVASFEQIPLTLAILPENLAFVPSADAVLEVDASGFNLTFEWLLGDDPDSAVVIHSSGAQLSMAQLNLIGGQSMTIRLRVSDGFGNSLLSEPILVSAESPLTAQNGWQQSDLLVGDIAVQSEELAYSTIYGWFFHESFPWIYLPELGWAHVHSDLFSSAGGQLMWLDSYEWIWIPSDSTGEFFIINQNLWGSF